MRLADEDGDDIGTLPAGQAAGGGRNHKFARRPHWQVGARTPPKSVNRCGWTAARAHQSPIQDPYLTDPA